MTVNLYNLGYNNENNTLSVSGRADGVKEVVGIFGIGSGQFFNVLCSDNTAETPLTSRRTQNIYMSKRIF